MAIMDGQNTFSTLATGDLPRTQADVACASTIDQGPKGLLFRGEGGAFIAPYLVSQVVVAFTSGSSAAYVQAVLQDDVDDGTGGNPNGTWADVQAGPAVIVTALTIGTSLAKFRIATLLLLDLRGQRFYMLPSFLSAVTTPYGFHVSSCGSNSRVLHGFGRL